MNWIPGESLDFDKPNLDGAPRLFDMTPQEAVDWFRDSGDPQAIWLDDGNYAKGDAQDWIAFRGAFLLEDGSRDLRWPLLQECSYYKDKLIHSALVVNNRGDEDQPPRYRFNLHLPLPLPRGAASGDWRNPPAFPFCAVYRCIPTSDGPPTAEALVAGWIEGDSTGAAIPGSQRDAWTSYVVKSADLPKNLLLGQFGFARSRNSMDGFAGFTGNPGATGKANHPERFWPTALGAPAAQILSGYGFSASIDAMGLPTGPADLSIRLPAWTPDEGARLVYRVRLDAAWVNASDDLPKQGALILNLADELAGRTAYDIHYGAEDIPELPTGCDVDGLFAAGGADGKLYIDLERSWDIPDDQSLWTGNPDQWSPHNRLTLQWTETVAALTDKTSAPVTPGALFQAGLLDRAAYTFGQTRAALPTGEAGLPHSFLPTLTAAQLTVRFSLCSPPVPVSLWGSVPRKRMQLSLADAGDLVESVGAGSISSTLATQLQYGLKASGISFFETSGVQLSLTLTKAARPAAGAGDLGEFYFASYKMRTTAVAVPWTGRLASLAFSGAAYQKLTEGLGQLRIGGRGQGSGPSAPWLVLLYPNGRVAAQLDLAVPLETVSQLGTDVQRFDRTGRAAPLLIPLVDPDPPGAQAKSDASVPAFWLQATETVYPREDRQLHASLSDTAKDQGQRAFVVLSAEPFSILRYASLPLSDRGDESSASVADYSGDTRVWEFKRAADLYHYVLPPQSVGESADKPRRLHIHDLPETGDQLPPRPFETIEKDDGTVDVAWADLHRRAVELRYTPSAEFWIRPSDVERGYFMPESQSYEIFRQSGAYGLGSALAYLKAEFLYGMPVGLDISKEDGIARGARVAEIEALTGRLPGEAGPDADPTLSGRWNALRAAAAARPERLEIWARDLDSTVDFTPARFSAGARFALRATALHRAPLKFDDNEDRDLEIVPRVGGVFPDAKAGQGLPLPRHHPAGLSGGALWPVESLNLFNILCRQPQSRGGVIEGIALSPLGGDAAQKAEFLGGKVTIISQTRNGHVERHQVEVLGRISAFWHRAKHVVVYERTINPSAQFAPKFKDDPKRTRSRRPILRKVREYIELLQPERAYPDFPQVASRASGFLDRVRFNAAIINVDSAWSSDVGDFGWRIPLWNRQSARERPQVYPLPDIAFVTAAEGDGDRPVVAQACLDPDYLTFFADFTVETSDTDKWVPRLDLDYPNMPAAKAIAALADSSSASPREKPSDRTEGRRRAVGRFLPGLRQFTWRLSPAARKTAINAGRASKPVFVGVDSVSFMRAGHADENQQALPMDLSKLLTTSTGFKPATPAVPGALAYWGADGKGATFEGADKFVEFMAEGGNFLKAVKEGRGGDAAALLKAFKDDPNLWGKVQTGLPAIAKDFNGSNLAAFKSTLKSGAAFCDKLKQDAIGTLKRKQMLVRTALADWLRDIEDILVEVDGTLGGQGTKEVAIAALANNITSYIRPIFTEASADIGNLNEGVEKARGAVADIEAEVEAVLLRARQRVEQFAAGYDRDKPWSNDRRSGFRDGVRACLSSVADDVLAAVEETRQRLAVELNDVSQAVAGHVAKLVAKACLIADDAHQRVTELSAPLDAFLGSIDTVLADLVADAGSGTLKIDALIADTAKIGDASLQAAIKALLEKVKLGIAKAQQAVVDARGAAQAADAAANAAEGDISTALDQLIEAVKTALDVLEDDAEMLVDAAKQIVDANAADLRKGILDLFGSLVVSFNGLLAWSDHVLDKIGVASDAIVLPAVEWTRSELEQIQLALRAVPPVIDAVAADAQAALSAAQDLLAPGALVETVIRNKVLTPLLDRLLQPIPCSMAGGLAAQTSLIRAALADFEDTVADALDSLTEAALGDVAAVSSACKEVFEGIGEAEDYLEQMSQQAIGYLGNQLDDAIKPLEAALAQAGNVINNVKEILATARAFDRTVRALHNDFARVYETAGAYTDRVFDAASRIDEGGILAAPNNVLKLYSAVTSAPELAALKSDIDRIRSGFDELSDIIDTTQSNALFNRLGDELKALGLSLPFNRIGETLLPADLSNIDIGKVFRSFGGAKLDSLFKGYKLPAGVRDAIRVTHDFDKKQARAWVQVDVKAPMLGRRSLFSIGIFSADFVDMTLIGQVRLEASKDTDHVTLTGFGRIDTVIDLVVGGQTMVSFTKFALSFTKEGGLKIDFDPTGIRLNPQFKFIQDFLSTLFGDLDPGGVKLIKENSIPVGVEHEYIIPPVALNFGTSGVSNISIENRFRLVAFPDFMLADRFNLSTVERPFIFSIFIIGGTGYIQIEAQYRPFDSELSVMVEAGAGGSAQLAFSFGPFSGQVFITLSGTLSYRKVIGKAGGGLAISVVIVIAGHVDVAGIVTVGITLMLRLTYRDNGQVDGDGSLSVTIRISQFFKLTARANVKYKLRGGQSQTQVSTGAGVSRLAVSGTPHPIMAASQRLQQAGI
ncbi:hypothetical protein [Mesorhizobium sp.]|uniref:hypothetical protein n=1 Tax=Mesorhizobium sp. TaxID=1871066 RepID=UPI000FE58EE5|nr:hypothetical protein [Mesorhizobium sp.]RWB69720.1 MAG: hypothetical protein EOQ49_19790 [Mesorhizobium sp.]